MDATLRKIDESIRANKRADGLYEAYNLIKFTDQGIEISHLYAMLEGQVAVLSSGILSGEEAADLLDTMRHSDLSREDHARQLCAVSFKGRKVQRRAARRRL